MMKTGMIALCLFSWGAQSHAQGVVTDLFECRAQIVDLKTNDSTESAGIAAGSRIVTPTQSADVETTMANAEWSLALNGRLSSYKVVFNLQYGFAKRPLGNPTEARQFVCNQVSLQSCRGDACSATSSICATFPNPFDPKYGWSVTSLLHNIPVFNEQLLHTLDTIVPIDSNDPNGAHITAFCKFKGTYF